MRVYGDIASSETRAILAILEAGQVTFSFKASKPVNNFDAVLSKNLDGLAPKDDDMSYIAKNTPVVEDAAGYKIMGGLHALMLYCSQKDQRNAQKFDEKGRPIKAKKVKVDSFCPPEEAGEVNRLLNWYLMKLRPHAQHMFELVQLALKSERGQDDS